MSVCPMMVLVLQGEVNLKPRWKQRTRFGVLMQINGFFMDHNQ